ncbi:MAG: hypothetical protein QW158_07640 [Nitrososphaerales archaeon]
MLTREIVSVEVVDLLAAVAVVILVAGLVYRFFEWRRVSPPNLWKDVRSVLGWPHIIGTFLKELVNRVLLQRDLFNERLRWFTHITMFWGFVGLALTTTISYLLNYQADYLPLTTHYRILGNTFGALLLLGSTIAVARLLASPRFRRNQTFSNIWFTALIWLAAITGFTTEYYREFSYIYPLDQTLASFLQVNYIAHIAVVGLLVLTAPHLGFIHALTTPSLRLYQRLHGALVTKTKTKDYREIAQEEQVQQLYTRTKVE